MEIELSDNFFYRIPMDKVDIYTKFNTSKENVSRNNNEIDLYAGEFVKIQQNEYVSHIVKPMENLEKIAKIHDTTIERLKDDNKLVNDKLFIGQIIKVKK